MFARLQPLKTKQSPFYGEIGGLRKVQFVRPELVAEIKFAEWTHETAEGGVNLRAPVVMGLRFDKPAERSRLVGPAAAPATPSNTSAFPLSPCLSTFICHLA